MCSKRDPIPVRVRLPPRKTTKLGRSSASSNYTCRFRHGRGNARAEQPERSARGSLHRSPCSAAKMVHSFAAWETAPSSRTRSKGAPRGSPSSSPRSSTFARASPPNGAVVRKNAHGSRRGPRRRGSAFSPFPAKSRQERPCRSPRSFQRGRAREVELRLYYTSSFTGRRTAAARVAARRRPRRLRSQANGGRARG